MGKIQLNLKKKNKVTKKVGAQNFQITPFVSLDQKAEIMVELSESYNQRMVEGEKVVPLICGIEADLHMILCRDFTNIDLTEVDYELLLASGVIDTVTKTIANYADLVNSVQFMITVLQSPTQSAMSSPEIQELVKKAQLLQLGDKNG